LLERTLFDPRNHPSNLDAKHYLQSGDIGALRGLPIDSYIWDLSLLLRLACFYSTSTSSSTRI